MISKEKYLSETKHAVTKLFDCISEYKELMRLGVGPVTTFRYAKEQDYKTQLEAWLKNPEVAEQFFKAERAREEYRAQLFSMHVISGSILQIACKAIELFSENRTLDSKFQFLFNGCNSGQMRKATKFCRGREVRGVPLGLVILAGRNQYNHMEDGANLNKLNSNIFECLATGHNYGKDVLDPAFDLDEEKLVSYSSNIRGIIGWDTFEDYIQDMDTLV